MYKVTITDSRYSWNSFTFCFDLMEEAMEFGNMAFSSYSEDNEHDITVTIEMVPVVLEKEVEA